MKTFNRQAAQGDVIFTRIDKLPPKEVLEQGKEFDEQGNYIVAHSETGHNHVMRADDVEFFETKSDPFVMYLVVNRATPIVHNRSFDTHESIKFDKGIYRVNRQREYVSEGFRRAAD